MSNPVTNVLSLMSGKTITLGWDVVVAYDADALNRLCAQQYIANVRAGEMLGPYTGTIDVSPTLQIVMAGVQLGPPLMSFSPKAAAQEAIVRMNFIAGDVWTLELGGNGQYVSGYQSIAPADQYALQMTVQIEQSDGEIVTGKNGKWVVISLQNASALTANLISGTSGATLVGNYFQSLFQNETDQTPLSFTIGSLVFGPSENLTPVWFEIRTQSKTGTTSDGAVLLFVATTFNSGGGELPGSSFPYVIPDGYGAAVVVSSKVLFENLIGPYYASQVDGGKFTVHELSGSDPASYLTFSSGAIPATHVKVITSNNQWETYAGSYSLSSPTNPVVFVPLNGMTIAPENDLLSINWSTSFSQRFTIIHNEHASSNVSLTVSANLTASATANPSNDVVSLSGSSPSVDISASLGHGFSHVIAGDSSVMSDAVNLIKTSVNATLKSFLTATVPHIDEFAVSHLIFPSQNGLQLSAAYLPGDLAAFGSVEPQETAITVTPLQTVIANGETAVFAASVSSPEWTVYPNIGSISSGGTLTPIAVSQPTTAAVTASANGASASALVTVVPQPVAISPAFALIMDGGATETFVASVVGGEAVTWSVSAGSISAGVYTAPATLPSGMTVAVVTATAGSNRAIAVVCLVNATIAFGITPPYATLGPGGSITFATSTTDSLPWSVLPSNAGSVTHHGKYTAPLTITQPSTVVVVAQAEDNSGLIGFAVVQLT